MNRLLDRIGLSPFLAAVVILSTTLAAEAQTYPAPQASVQSSPQSYGAVPCFCPFPQGYCPFPQGYCALPASYCGPATGSPQGTVAAPPYAYQGYSAKPYPAPTPFMPRPLGIPSASMPTSQGYAMPMSQFAPGKSW